MSNHFDDITTTEHPEYDISDFAVFKGDTGTVLVMNTNPQSSANWTGPGWNTDANYDFKLDIGSHQTGVADLAFRARFSGHTHDDGSPSAQRWSLSMHLGPGANDPESIGIPLLANATTDTVHNTCGVRAFAGTAGDPFYIAFPVVTAVRTSVLEGTKLDRTAWDPATTENAFKGTNVNTIVIEFPNMFGLFDGLKIGAWSSVTIPADNGTDWRQVDRAGKPMITTLYGFNEADDYHHNEPSEDFDKWGPKVEELTERSVRVNETQDDPDEYASMVRDDLYANGGDVLNYVVGSDAHYVGGEFNGRNLTEKVADDMYRVVIGAEVDSGLDHTDATGQLRDEFPYLSLPADPA